MIAIGCLPLIILPLTGPAVGGFVGGAHAAVWSVMSALMVAALIVGVTALALVKAGHRLRGC